MSKRPPDTRTGTSLVSSSTDSTTAVSQLVEANLRLVVGYAHRFQKCGLPIVELIHAGNLGLMEAARRFDTSRAATFVGYASWWVRQAMIHAIADRTGLHPMSSSVLATPVVDRIVSIGQNESVDDGVDLDVVDDGEDADIDETFHDIQARANGTPRNAERLRSHLN